jgi:hypothetical protein
MISSICNRVGRFLSLQRIDDFEKGKTVKVGISSADLPDTVITHDDGCVRVVKQFACEVRNFSENLFCHHGMPLRIDEEH